MPPLLLARRRLRGRMWPIMQTAAAAVAAWYLAQALLGRGLQDRPHAAAQAPADVEQRRHALLVADRSMLRRPARPGWLGLWQGRPSLLSRAAGLPHGAGW